MGGISVIGFGGGSGGGGAVGSISIEGYIESTGNYAPPVVGRYLIEDGVAAGLTPADDLALAEWDGVSWTLVHQFATASEFYKATNGLSYWKQTSPASGWLKVGDAVQSSFAVDNIFSTISAGQVAGLPDGTYTWSTVTPANAALLPAGSPGDVLERSGGLWSVVIAADDVPSIYDRNSRRVWLYAGNGEGNNVWWRAAQEQTDYYISATSSNDGGRYQTLALAQADYLAKFAAGTATRGVFNLLDSFVSPATTLTATNVQIQGKSSGERGRSQTAIYGTLTLSGSRQTVRDVLFGNAATTAPLVIDSTSTSGNFEITDCTFSTASTLVAAVQINNLRSYMRLTGCDFGGRLLNITTTAANLAGGVLYVDDCSNLVIVGGHTALTIIIGRNCTNVVSTSTAANVINMASGTPIAYSVIAKLAILSGGTIVVPQDSLVVYDYDYLFSAPSSYSVRRGNLRQYVALSAFYPQVTGSFDPSKFRAHLSDPDDLFFPEGADTANFDAFDVSALQSTTNTQRHVWAMSGTTPQAISSGYWNGLTASISTQSQAVAGHQSLSLSFLAGRTAGQGVAIKLADPNAFPFLAKKFNGRLVTVEFAYYGSGFVANGNSGDSFGWYLYDYGSNRTIHPVDTPFVMVGLGSAASPRRVRMQFQIPTDAGKLGLCIIACNSITGAAQLYLGDFSSKATQVTTGAAVFQLQDYAPQITGLGGTAPTYGSGVTESSKTMRCYRHGSRFRGTWNYLNNSGTAGSTGAASVYVFSLPQGVRFSAAAYPNMPNSPAVANIGDCINRGYMVGSFEARDSSYTYYDGKVYIYSPTQFVVTFTNRATNVNGWWGGAASFFGLSPATWNVELDFEAEGWSSLLALSSTMASSNEFVDWQEVATPFSVMPMTPKAIAGYTGNWYYKDFYFPKPFPPNVAVKVTLTNFYQSPSGDSFAAPKVVSRNDGFRLWVYRTDAPGGIYWGSPIYISYKAEAESAQFQTIATDPTIWLELRLSTNIAQTDGGTVVFNTARSVGNISYDTATGNITILANGIYRFGGLVQYNSNAYCGMIAYHVPSATQYLLGTGERPSNWVDFAASADIRCNVGDVIRLIGIRASTIAAGYTRLTLNRIGNL